MIPESYTLFFGKAYTLKQNCLMKKSKYITFSYKMHEEKLFRGIIESQSPLKEKANTR